jgi:hypothetical protein
MSGSIALDFRGGAMPSDVVITLVPAGRMSLCVKGEPANGLRFVVTDEQGMDLVSSRFYGSEPRALTLPPGKYRVALIDANKSVLQEQSVTLGSAPMTIELKR